MLAEDKGASSGEEKSAPETPVTTPPTSPPPNHAPRDRSKFSLKDSFSQKVAFTNGVTVNGWCVLLVLLLLVFILWWTNQIESDIKSVVVLTLFYLIGYRIYILERRVALLDLQMQKSQ